MRDIAVLLWPHARPHQGLLISGALLSALVVVFRIAQPWPLKWMLDLLTGRPPHHVLGGLVDKPELGIAALSVMYVGLTLLAGAAEYGQLITLAGLGNRVMYSFRAQLFTHVLRQPLAFHEGREEGELLTRIVYDTARLRQGVNGLLTRVVQTLVTFVAMSIVLLWLDARLAAVLAVSGAVALIAMGRIGRRIIRAARKQRRREGRLASLVAEDLLGVRELHAYRTGEIPDSRFSRQNVKSLQQEQKVRRLGAALLLRTEVLLALSVTLILWLGARAVQAGELTPGGLVLFVTYAVGLYRPFAQFARQTARSGKTFACAERLTKIMQEAPAIGDKADAIAAPVLRGDLVFEDVSVTTPKKRRGGRKWALQDVTFRAAAGERLAIVGANGAGKSSLLRVVLRLTDPTGGVLRLDGRDIRDYTLESLRRQMSVVFQDSVLFGLTVRENIALGNEHATDEEVRAAAERACLHTLVARLPQGYDTPVRHRGGLFSGGERQRIALARALLREGRIWLLDEPTNGLDATTAKELVSLLLDATAGRTSLWVTHDPAILPQVDRVLVLEEGRVAFTGSPGDYGRWLVERVSGAGSTREA
jgi:ATP-binding cassette subfamily B protein